MRRAPRLGLFVLALVLACDGWSGAIVVDPEQEAARALDQAQQALEQQQPLLAEQWLERALMYRPDDAEARLVLARLMAGRGAHAPAIAIVQSLLDDPLTPEAFRPGLAQVLRHYREAQAIGGMAQAGATTGAPPVAGLQFGLQLGWARNPASRTDDASLPLTTDQGILELPLSQRPRSGLTDSLSLGWTTPSGHRLWGQTLGASVAGATRVHQVGADYRLDAGWAVSSELRYQGGQTQRWTVTVARALQDWIALAGCFDEPERQRRGVLLGAQALLWHTPVTQAQTALTLEFNTRPQGVGGHLLEWQYRQQQHLADGLEAQFNLRLQGDSAGYSPLLENDSPRRLATLRAGLAWRPWESSSGALEIYHERRYSNIGLFAYHDSGLLWRRQWVW